MPDSSTSRDVLSYQCLIDCVCESEKEKHYSPIWSMITTIGRPIMEGLLSTSKKKKKGILSTAFTPPWMFHISSHYKHKLQLTGQLFILHCTKFGHFWEKTWKPENLFAVFQGLCSKSERRSSGQMRPICHIMACIKKWMQAIPSTVIYSTTYYCNTQYVAENTHY